MAEPLSRFQVFEILFKVIATAVTLGTVITGAFSYFENQTKQQEAAQEALRAKVWSERIRLYDEGAAAAASLAASYATLIDTDPADSPFLTARKEAALADYVKSRSEFWRLYWGNMSLLEDKSVERAMLLFGKGVEAADRALESNPASADESSRPSFKARDLERMSYHLAHVMRESLGETWPSQAFRPLFDSEAPADSTDDPSSKPLQAMRAIAIQAGLINE